MPTMNRKTVDIWTCDICGRESRYPATARNCEDGHITALEDMQKQRDEAEAACQRCEHDRPCLTYTKNNHRWNILDHLITRAETVIAKREANTSCEASSV